MWIQIVGLDLELLPRRLSNNDLTSCLRHHRIHTIFKTAIKFASNPTLKCSISLLYCGSGNSSIRITKICLQGRTKKVLGDLVNIVGPVDQMPV